MYEQVRVGGKGDRITLLTIDENESEDDDRGRSGGQGFR
jgi:hypothetical protein